MASSTSPSVSAAAEMKRKNLRLGLILGSVAAVFFAGFVLKMVLLGQSH